MSPNSLQNMNLATVLTALLTQMPLSPFPNSKQELRSKSTDLGMQIDSNEQCAKHDWKIPLKLEFDPNLMEPYSRRFSARPAQRNGPRYLTPIETAR
jgi:hypothetical protein